MRQLPSRSYPRAKLLPLLIASCFAMDGLANPVGPSVVSGTVGLATSGQTLTVTNSPNAVINWQGFSIGAGEITRFQQQSAASAVLNRVVGQDPSAILGTLSSNGRVFLVNPNGILFGQGARVDVAGLVATTLNISNNDFLAGRLNFEAGAVANSIVSQGEIVTGSGGRVLLLAPDVQNHGLISTPQGEVMLAAGRSVQLVEADLPMLKVEVASGGEALNVGRILAEGGKIGVYAGLIKHSGIARADSVTTGAGGQIRFKASNSVTLEAGSVISADGAGTGGAIEVGSDVVLNSGQLSANGLDAGSIAVTARNYLGSGTVSADGSSGSGGAVSVSATGGVIQTASELFSARGASRGGSVSVSAGGQVFSSATIDSSGGLGGSVAVLAQDIRLNGATLDASGRFGGGTILVGGDYRGGNPAVSNASTNWINYSTQVRADAGETGNGGKVIVWSDSDTRFGGSISVRGGAQSGDGGFVEVSGKEGLVFAGNVNAQAPNGQAGSVLLDPKNIVVDAASTASISSFQLVDPNQGSSQQFPGAVVTLSNGNVVATDPFDSFAANSAGAVYLFNSSTGALISTLTGSSLGDQVGSDGITALTGNNNYIVRSPLWGSLGTSTNARGAVTWASGSTGVTGTVSAANSLVGAAAGDRVGSSGVTALTNGNYVVSSSLWNNPTVTASAAGAVTWGDGSTGTTGSVTTANSLVGSMTNNNVGSGGVVALTNGNYVVVSESWDNISASAIGAVTWRSGTAASAATVSAANSLVGTTTNDQVGFGGVTALTNGNYVVNSWTWNNTGAGANVAGAVTWGSGTSGISGTVSSANSLVGTTAVDLVGSGGVTALANGNYVVRSSSWDNGAVTSAGAVTWGSGTAGVAGAVSSSNSLVGTTSFDQVGSGGVAGLTNGNYVVASPSWNNTAATASSAGAVTWGDGTSGISGAVSAANSFVGVRSSDLIGTGGVFALNNGNYVIASPSWANGTVVGAGAATWRNGGAATTGSVTIANSLVGTNTNDSVGSGGVATLTNGNYVVLSPSWNNGGTIASGLGATTWGNGTTGTTGTVGVSNSLVGAVAGDRVGFSGVTALANGNYVVKTSTWNGSRGAATFGSGATGTTGTVSSANSLVGNVVSDLTSLICGDGCSNVMDVIALTGGDYVVRSSQWDNGTATNVGAVTWGSGVTGVSGSVSTANSLIGTNANDQFGSGVVASLPGGRFLVSSPTLPQGTASQAGALHVAIPPGSFANPLQFADSASSTITISPTSIASLTNQGTAVTLQANTDITVNSAIVSNNASGNGGAITLQAGRSVLLNSSITTDSGNLIITANDSAAQAGNRDAGTATITMASGASVTAGDGAISLTLSSAGVGPTGDITLGGLTTTASASVLNQGAGAILRNATATPITGSAIVLAGGSIGTNTAGGNIGLSPGASGTVNLTATAGEIAVEQQDAPLLMSKYTLSAPVGQDIRLVSSGGNLVIDSDVNTAGTNLFLHTTGAFDVTFSGSRTLSGTGSLALEPLGTGSVLQSAGTTTLNATTTIGGAAFTLSGGTLQGTGTVTVETAMTWTGGDLSGTGKLVVGPSASLAVSGASSRSIFNGYDLDNLGTVNLTHSGTVFVSGTPTTFVTNSGVWNANQTAAFGEEVSGGSFRFTNDSAGTVNRTVTGAGTILNLSNDGALNVQAGTLSIDNRGGFSSAGTFRIDSGATLRFVNSAHTINGSFVNGTGAGTLALSSTTLNIGANVSMDDAVQIPTGSTFSVNSGVTASVGSVALSGGTLTGTGSLTVTTDFNQTSGTMGTSFNNLSITKASGDLSAAGFGATNALSLTASAGSVNVTTAIAAGGDITLDAQGAGSNVNISANISKTAGADATLTARAAGDIAFSGGADVTSSSNKLHVVLNSDRDASGAGAISLGSGTVLTSNGGNVTLGGGATPASGFATGNGSNVNGMLLNGATINAAGGDVVIRGRGAGGVHNASGVRMGNGAVVQTTTGAITLTGEGGTGLLGGSNRGVFLFGAGTEIKSDAGTISLTGTGGSSTGVFDTTFVDGNNRGVAINDGAAIRAGLGGAGLGDIHLIGTGGSSVERGGNSGVLISQDSALATKVTAVNGTIDIQGSAGTTTGASATVGANRGVSIGAAEVRTTGAGGITITGIGGSSVNNTATSTNSGVLIQGDPDFAETFVTTAGGNLSITGTAGSNSGTGGGHEGIAIVNHATVQTDGSGTLTLSGTAAAGNSAILLQANGSSANPDHVHVEAGATLDVTANGLLTLAAGSTLANAYVELVSNGSQTIDATGIVVAGGASGGGAGTGNYAEIGAGGSQTIVAGASGISLTGGDGTENRASIFAQGAQTITASAINLTGGAAGTSNSAAITMDAAGALQTISADSITLDGGARLTPAVAAGGMDSGNFASLVALGNQEVYVGAGGLTIRGGGGTLTDNRASIYQGGADTTALPGSYQYIEISGGGSVTMVGGSSAQVNVSIPNPPPFHGSYASIRSDGDTQDIHFVSGGAISMTGGTVGSNNYAIIRAPTGTQTISGEPDITVTGGASGGVDGEGNYALIQANLGAQDIAANNLTVAGGAGGINNFAVIQAPTQGISVLGDLVITGGSSAASADGTTGGGARIGGLGGTGATATNLVLAVDGNVTLTGGSVSGAAIGSNIQGGQTTDVVMSVGGNVTLDPGTGVNGGSRIGSPIAGVAGGDITLLAGGNIAMNSSGPGLGSSVRTLGNVTLDANAITQGADAVLDAGGFAALSTVAGTTLAGTSNIGTLVLAAGNLTLSGTLTTSALLIPDGITLNGTGTVIGDVSNSGTVAPGTSAGLLTVSGNYTQSSTGALTVEIGGTTVGTEYDRLAVSGTASLDGTLNVSEGAVAPVAGTIYTVITCGVCTGTFAAVNSPTVNVTPTYAATSFSLPFTSFLNSWNSGGTGAWETASNWSRGVVPGASDDVTIDDPSGVATITVSSGTQTARSIVSSENLTLSGGSLNLAAPSTVNGTFTLSGGTLGGLGSLTLNGAFSWSSGTISNTGGLITAGTSTISGSGLTLGSPWSNSGTATISGGELLASAGVTNTGTIDLSGASSIRLPSGGPAFSNAAGGTLNIDSTAGWSFVSNPTTQDGVVDNAGTINVNNGTSWEAAFTQTGTGSLNIAAGKSLSLQNGQSIAGTVNVGTGSTLWVSERHGVNASFSGTTIGGNGTVQVVGGAGPVADFTNVSAPSAKLLVGSGGTANVLAGTTTFAALEITGGTLDGSGTLNVTASLNQSGGSQSGAGTTVLASGATGALGAVSIGRNLTNIGTLDLSGTSISGLFTNAGVVNVTGVVSASGGMMQNAGLTTVPAGQTLGVGGSGLVLAGGTLVGNGTIDGDVFNTAGIVAPGASPGILTINGDYTQGANGALTVDVGGTIAGSEYDQLVVNGDVFLDGNLNTTLFGSYTPLPGDSYTFISATGTITGSFANVSQPAGLLPPTAGPATTSGSQLTVSAISASLPPAIEPTYNYTVVATEISSEPVENILIPVLGIEGTAGTEESSLEKKPPACS